jgi:hypothetical protein
MTTTHILETAEAGIAYDVRGPLLSNRSWAVFFR